MVVLWNETEVVYFLLFVKIPGLCGNPNMASFKLESKRNRVGKEDSGRKKPPPPPPMVWSVTRHVGMTRQCRQS